MRCLTLAKELKDRGAEVCFICRSHLGNLNDLIRNNGFEVLELNSPSNKNQEELAILSPRGEYGKWLGVTWERDAQETLSALGKEQPDWLIVDHYALDKAWESTIRPKVEKIMVIDDLADREHDCDLLLDQNFYLEPQSRYSNLVPLSCTKLLGPEFALLRPEFKITRDNRKKRTYEIKRVFLFFGGTDQVNATSKTLMALSSPDMSYLEVDVVIGEKNPHREEIQTLVKDRKKTTLHLQVSNISEIMVRSDLAIGAGGTTNWERLYLGLPSIVITVADNQVEIAKDLSNAGIIKWLGHFDKVSVSDIQDAIRKSLKETIKPKRLKKCQIASKVNDQLLPLLLGQLREIKATLRPAKMEDCKLFWNWANDPDVRKYAFTKDFIPFDTHEKWFEKKMADKELRLYVLESDYGPIGQIRLEGQKSTKKLSYSIGRQFRRLGFGRYIVNKLIEMIDLDVKEINAEVLNSNINSLKIFRSLGFSEFENCKENSKLFVKNLTPCTPLLKK
jgi:UDP-2,4-diacetamido-2,4,6-trideoxy-beta-L-altropyranose hydrolase